MRTFDLAGAWRCNLPGQSASLQIPGTLDESGIGFADKNANAWHPEIDLGGEQGCIATRLTRCFTYEGPAVLTRRFRFRPTPGKRVFFEVERARCLTVRINGVEAPPFLPPSLSAPQVFEVTNLMTGDDELAVVSDNSYPGLPREAIVYSSAATDETQTNWNGLLGFVRLREEESTFIHAVRVYPAPSSLTVKLDVSAEAAGEEEIRLESGALERPVHAVRTLAPGMNELTFANLPLLTDVRLWDEDEGNLYGLRADVGASKKTVTFGVRTFGVRDGRFALNGRAIFLRGETNCCVFPQTGHPPMEEDAWQHVLQTYRGYGANLVRFHSHIPPEAAFVAADRLGMLLAPELSHWNPATAFEDEASWRYYQTEMDAAVRQLANHPSFVMMTWGNELAAGELGHRRMTQLLDAAHALDSTRLFACASNAHYGNAPVDSASDFYTAQGLGKHDLRATFSDMRGCLNQRYLGARNAYDEAVCEVRKTFRGPVLGFEVGQFEVLPDFGQISDYRGVTRPDNLRLIAQRVARSGLQTAWKQYVEASGELSLLCYREEVEAALRTEGMGGLALLGLQDFPGQGTALVGMLDSLLRPKPYAFARPERFAAFFRDVLPLALLQKHTYIEGETLRAQVRVANYGKRDLSGPVRWRLMGAGYQSQGELPAACAPMGGLRPVGELSIALPQGLHRLTLEISMEDAVNRYPVWVYPAGDPVRPQSVYECRWLDGEALRALQGGGVVYLAPDSTAEALPNSVQAQFSTDFWSVGTFAGQSGAMGQLIDAAHPLFEDFPTQSHTDWQWWRLAGQRAVILPRRLQAIVTEMDSYAFLRPMAKLVECRCAGGRLLLSTFGLHRLLDAPEARALQKAIYRYLTSERFAPKQEMTPQEINAMVRAAGT